MNILVTGTAAVRGTLFHVVTYCSSLEHVCRVSTFVQLYGATLRRPVIVYGDEIRDSHLSPDNPIRDQHKLLQGTLYGSTLTFEGMIDDLIDLLRCLVADECIIPGESIYRESNGMLQYNYVININPTEDRCSVLCSKHEEVVFARGW